MCDMAHLPMPEGFDLPDDNDTPLPLIVAKRWDFPLAYVETDEGIHYAIHDWLRGLTGEEDVRLLWAKFKKQEAGKQMYPSSKRLPYVASDGKTYKRDFVIDR